MMTCDGAATWQARVRRAHLWPMYPIYQREELFRRTNYHMAVHCCVDAADNITAHTLATVAHAE